MHAKARLSWLSRRVWGVPLVAIAAAVAVIAGTGGGYAIASTNTPITPSVPVYACDSGTGRVLQQAYTTQSAFEQQNCNGFEVTLNGAGVQSVSVANGKLVITKLDGTTVSTALPSTGPTTASASIGVTNDPDTAAVTEPLQYSNGGIWALDNFTLTISITSQGAADLSKCANAPAGNATCYYYTGTASVAGTFKSLGGNTVSPLGGKTMTGVVQGSLNGTFAFNFYADSGSLSASGVPATVDNTGEAFAAGSNAAAWYAGFFPAGTKIASAAGNGVVSQPNYSFTYVATSENCTSPQVQETMVQAFSGNTGDITGTCAAAS